MAEYVYIQKYNKQGIMGISYQVFDKIAEIATNEVSGATVSRKRYSLSKPVRCTIRSGTVNVKISVKVSPNTNAEEVANEVRENVALSLTQMTELIPFDIDVEVIDVV